MDFNKIFEKGAVSKNENVITVKAIINFRWDKILNILKKNYTEDELRTMNFTIIVPDSSNKLYKDYDIKYDREFPKNFEKCVKFPRGLNKKNTLTITVAGDVEQMPGNIVLFNFYVKAKTKDK